MCHDESLVRGAKSCIQLPHPFAVCRSTEHEITNTTDSAISYTEIKVKFYDSEDTRLGEGLDNASDLGGGETYAYDVLSLLSSDKADSIASYTITVSDSGF